MLLFLSCPAMRVAPLFVCLCAVLLARRLGCIVEKTNTVSAWLFVCAGLSSPACPVNLRKYLPCSACLPE